MEIQPEKFIRELTQRTIDNYDFIKRSCAIGKAYELNQRTIGEYASILGIHEQSELFEVTQLINSMYSLLVVPEEIFGYKNGGFNSPEFETIEKNLKKYPPYHEINALIKDLLKHNRLKYFITDIYTEESPVSCLLYNMRNALCHDDIGFLPITSPDGKSEITDVIFRDGRGHHIKFMLVIRVEKLELLLRNVAKFYTDVENGKASANKEKYIKYYKSFENDLKNFIGEYD